MEQNIIMHLGCYNVSYMYYCAFYRCPVAVTINEHQWEVVVDTFSCFVCYQAHSSAGSLALECREYGQRLSTARYTRSHRLSGSGGW